MAAAMSYGADTQEYHGVYEYDDRRPWLQSELSDVMYDPLVSDSLFPLGTSGRDAHAKMLPFPAANLSHASFAPPYSQMEFHLSTVGSLHVSEPFQPCLMPQKHSCRSESSDEASSHGDTFSPVGNDDYPLPSPQHLSPNAIVLGGMSAQFATSSPFDDVFRSGDFGIAPSFVQSIPDQLSHEPPAEAQQSHHWSSQHSSPRSSSAASLILDPALKLKEEEDVKMIDQDQRSESSATSSRDGDFEEDDGDDDWTPENRSSNKRHKGTRTSRSPRTSRTAGQRPVLSSASPSSTSEASRVVKSRGKEKSRPTPQFDRAFPCPLALYGCRTSFKSKNEWKRHIGTKHILLYLWHCDECDKDPNNPEPNDFNRKDLFTTHVRRKHIDGGMDEKGRLVSKVLPEEDAQKLAEYTERCCKRVRNNPPTSSCVVCAKRFSDERKNTGSWEECIDHMAGHFEAKKNAKRVGHDLQKWHRDEELEAWLEEQGLIERMDGEAEWRIGSGVPTCRAASP